MLEQAILHSRILVVDDQPANVTLLLRLLAEAGYCAVESTTDPTTVADLHRHCDYDLILLDLQMPGFDGFEVMSALQAGAGSGYLPVIVITAHPANKLRALQAGAKDFISKPFDLLELKTRIHNMLEVRLLYRQLAAHNERLEREVAMRTAELRASQERYRSLTELASDWYWEQDAMGRFTQVSGPVREMLGVDIAAGELAFDAAATLAAGWDMTERSQLLARLAARQPFLDFSFGRIDTAGVRHRYRVSGEPMYDAVCHFTGYRGIGIEVPAADTGAPSS